jgi:ABC-type transport system substrate-binding protein
VRWDSGERLVLARNDSYHRRGAPGLDGIDYAMGVSEDLAWFKYESGELDVTDIPAAEFPRVMRTPRYRNLIRSATTMTTMYLGMNCEWPPFDDVLVRRAVNHAVNKEKVLRLINRRGVVAAGFIPPDMPGHQPRLQGYPHDPEQAKTLLALAGHGAGFRTTLWIRADDDAMRIGQAVQQDLREVGIAVDLRPLSWGPFLDAVRTRGVVPFFFLGWQADFPDPSNFLETLLHSKNRDSNNHTFFSDPVVDALLDLAAKETNPSRRLRLLRKAERRAISEAPWVFLYHPSTHVLVSPRVRDYRLHPLRPPRFDRVWIGEATDPDAPAPPGS